MGLSLAIVLALFAGQDVPRKYLDAARGVDLPADLAEWRARHGKAVAVIEDRAVWARGLQLIDERLGLFVERPEIRVVVADNDEPRPAKGGGRRGKGEVHFNLRRMTEHIRRIEEFDRMRDYGKEVKFRVPPTPVASLVHHELVHCFAGTYDEPWLTEGLATYAAGETAHLWDFQDRKAALGGLDEAMADRDAYARGYCAVAWLQSALGDASFKALVATLVEEKAAPRRAIEEATGLSWKEACAREKEWARALLKEHTPRE